MRSMEFDDGSALLSASPSSPNLLCGRFSPVAAAHDLPPRSSIEVAAASASYRSGVFEVSKGTFSSARVQPLAGSQ
jgi:hypothetical protein